MPIFQFTHIKPLQPSYKLQDIKPFIKRGKLKNYKDHELIPAEEIEKAIHPFYKKAFVEQILR